MNVFAMRKHAWFLPVILLSLALSSCAHVQLVAPYDERIEKDVVALQESTTRFFVMLERQEGSTQQDYPKHIVFYDNAKVVTRGLLIRTRAVPTNEKTAEQVQLLAEKYRSLEEQHRTRGLSLAVSRTLEPSFDQIFRAILALEIGKKELKAY